MGTAACGWSLKSYQATATENIKVDSHSSFQMIMLHDALFFVLLNFTDSLWQCSVLFSHIFWKIWKSLFGLGPAVCLWSGHRSDEHCWLDSYVAPYADLDVFTLPSGGVNGDETHDAIYYAMHAATRDAIRPCKSILIVHYPCRSSCRWQSFQHSLYRQSRQNCQGLSQASRPHGREFNLEFLWIIKGGNLDLGERVDSHSYFSYWGLTLGRGRNLACTGAKMSCLFALAMLLS